MSIQRLYQHTLTLIVANQLKMYQNNKFVYRSVLNVSTKCFEIVISVVIIKKLPLK